MPSSRPPRLRTAFLTVLSAMLVLAFATHARAEDKVLRIGTLKLIHGISAYFYEKFVPPGYTVEVIPFQALSRRALDGRVSPDASTGPSDGTREAIEIPWPTIGRA